LYYSSSSRKETWHATTQNSHRVPFRLIEMKKRFQNKEFECLGSSGGYLLVWGWGGVGVFWWDFFNKRRGFYVHIPN